MEFSRKLRGLIRIHRYSQETLAKEVGVSQNLVSLWARGKSFPDLMQAGTMARLFGVPLDYLADDSRDEPTTAVGGKATGHDLDPDEWYIVRAARAFGLSFEEAVRRLAGEPGGKAREGGVGQTFAHRDLSEVEREKKRRSGLEPDPKEGQVAKRKDGGPGPGDR